MNNNARSSFINNPGDVSSRKSNFSDAGLQEEAAKKNEENKIHLSEEACKRWDCFWNVLYFPFVFLWTVTLPEFWIKKNFGLVSIAWGYIVCVLHV